MKSSKEKEKTKLLLQGAKCDNCRHINKKDASNWCEKSVNEPVDSICLEYKKSSSLPELMRALNVMTSGTGIDMMETIKKTVSGSNRGMFELVLKSIQDMQDDDSSKRKN